MTVILFFSFIVLLTLTPGVGRSFHFDWLYHLMSRVKTLFPRNRAFIKVLFLSVLLLGAAAGQKLSAQSCPNWALVGTASGSGTAVTLTQAIGGESGACWNTAPLDLTQAITLKFNAYFGAAGGADGIDFVIQNDPRTTSAISGNGTPCGACRGYSGVNPITPSVALGIADFTSNGILAPQENGLAANTCGFTVAPSVACPFTFAADIKNSLPHAWTFIWTPNVGTPANSTLQTIFVDNAGAPQTMTYQRDLIGAVFGGATTAYYGFTGAKGATTTFNGSIGRVFAIRPRPPRPARPPRSSPSDKPASGL